MEAVKLATSDKRTIIGLAVAAAAGIAGGWLSLHDSVNRHDVQIETISETVKETSAEVKAFRNEWSKAKPE